MSSFYRALSPNDEPTGGRRSPERMHTTGALRRSQGSRDPLAPLHSAGGVEDWLDQSASRSSVAAKAAAIRHEDDDWEPQIGDGERSKAPPGKSQPAPRGARAGKSRPDSPDFQMPGFDGIMEKARTKPQAMDKAAERQRPRGAEAKHQAVPQSPAVSSVRAPGSAAASQHSSGIGQYRYPPPDEALGGQHGVMNQTHGSTAFTEASRADLGSVAEEVQPIRKERSEPTLRGGAQRGAQAYPGMGSSPMHGQSPMQQEPGRIRPRRVGSASTGAAPGAAPVTSGHSAGAVPTRGFVQLQPGAMLAQLLTTAGGIDAVDEHGWTPLHWASSQRKPEHVAALLDTGANAHLQSTAMVGGDHPGGGERPMGTTSMQLARFPADGGKPDSKVVKLLAAGERGGWRQRREFKEMADAAMGAGDYAAAVEFYEKALGAVLQVQDTAAMQLTVALAAAEDAVQSEEEDQAREYEKQRAIAEAEQRALAAREAEAREQERQALEVLRNAEDLLEDGDVTSAVRVVEERADQLLRPSAPEAAERARIFLWNAIGRLQAEQQAALDRMAARAEQVSQLQSKLTSAETELAASGGAATAQTQVIRSLEAQLSGLARERDTAVDNAGTVTAEMESLRGDCVGTLQSAEEREAKLNEEQKRLDAELHTAKAAEDAAKAEVETSARAAAEKVDGVEREKVALAARVEELQAELAAGGRLATELEQKLAQAVEQSEKAMAAADGWQTKYTDATGTVGELQKQLAAAVAMAEEQRAAGAAAESEWERISAMDKQTRDEQVAAATESHQDSFAAKEAEHATAIEALEKQLAAKDQAAVDLQQTGAAAVASEREVAAALRQTVEAEKAARSAAVETLRQESTKILAEQADSAKTAREAQELKLSAARAGHDETRRELEELQSQLQTNREEAAALSRRLGATDDERELERRAMREETEKATAGAAAAAEKSAGEQKALTDQAQWRETLRKKVEERCVKLESTVADLSDQNTKLTQRLAETATSLANTRDAEESKSNEVQRLERALEAAASAQQTLREEAAERQQRHATALEVAAEQQEAAVAATAVSAETAAAIQAKLATEWAATAQANGTAENARAESRRLTDTVAQRDLTIVQLRTAADRAVKNREQMAVGHTEALHRAAAEHADRLAAATAERDLLAGRVDKARAELLAAEQATLTEAGEAERLAVEIQNSRLREDQLVVALEERDAGMKRHEDAAVAAAEKAAAELAAAADQRKRLEGEIGTGSKALEVARRDLTAAERKAAATAEASDAAALSAMAAEEAAADVSAEKIAVAAELAELGQRWAADLETAAADRSGLLRIIEGKAELSQLEAAGMPEPAKQQSSSSSKAGGSSNRRTSVISTSSSEDGRESVQKQKPSRSKQGSRRLR